MKLDIFFATNRFTISTTPTDDHTITPQGEYGVARTDLQGIFSRNSAVTLLTTESEFERCYENFARQFIPVTAAGGVVERGDGKILMIYRNKRWDLPKGHWEEGETIEKCAVREVEEETGVVVATLGTKICETLHGYYLRNKWELKRTHWYNMTSDDTTPLTPQQEEGIERAEWLTPDEITRSIAGSFPTIQRVMMLKSDESKNR